MFSLQNGGSRTLSQSDIVDSKDTLPVKFTVMRNVKLASMFHMVPRIKLKEIFQLQNGEPRTVEINIEPARHC